MSKMTVDTAVQSLKGVGAKRAASLAAIGIATIGDLLEYFPYRYEDRSQCQQIADFSDGMLVSFTARLVYVTASRARRGLTITKMSVQDDSGEAVLSFFNQPYLKKSFQAGMELFIYGKVKKRGNQVELISPDIQASEDSSSEEQALAAIQPVYRLSGNLTQRWLRSLMKQALAGMAVHTEVLPEALCQQQQLMTRQQALADIHFPSDMLALQAARRRLVFEELFLLQCGLAYIRWQNRQHGRGMKHRPDGRLLRQLMAALPFTLTSAQQQAWQEIKADMEDKLPMQRLLQGDVGSGKTVLAALALAKTVESGCQGALMVPTEILAEQHFQTLQAQYAGLPLRAALLTGRLPAAERRQVAAELAAGHIDIVIGTHALIQDSVVFKDLGLVVTDEQHRFGVRQRAKLQGKGTAPDVLAMTATPIPRTMALTVYGDLDVSTIRQLPPGRKPIKTYVRNHERRALVYQFVREQLQQGRQAYVVCPLVEDSDKINAQSAVSLYEDITGTYLHGIPCGLVHGKMNNQEKDDMMTAFYRNELKLLIATTVIEVGVNVPNAVVMVVENADRFGLSQLHQLRGRIGRGEHQSYCILLSDNDSAESQERLSIMAATQDGFALAEQDLLLRGPGKLFGETQHGLPDLKVADILQDTEVLLQARQAARRYMKQPDFFRYIETVLAQHNRADFKKILQS